MSSPLPDHDAVLRDGAPVVLARAGLRVAVPLAAVITLGAFALRGVAGGLTALVASVLLLGIHFGTAKVATLAGRISPQALQAATMFGFLLRIALYGVLALTLNDVAGVDAPVLGVVVVGLTVAMLVAEATLAARSSKYWWQLDEQSTGQTETAVPAVSGKDHA